MDMLFSVFVSAQQPQHLLLLTLISSTSGTSSQKRTKTKDLSQPGPAADFEDSARRLRNLRGGGGVKWERAPELCTYSIHIHIYIYIYISMHRTTFRGCGLSGCRKLPCNQVA